jgi:hypothetical protein
VMSPQPSRSAMVRAIFAPRQQIDAAELLGELRRGGFDLHILL